MRPTLYVTAVVALLASCTRAPSAPLGAASIQTSSPTAGVTATIAGDRVEIRNGLPTPIEYALIEERWLEQGLASHCFGSGGCGRTILPSQTATPLVASADHLTPSATRLVVVWWPISEEPPPMGGPTTPYKIVLPLQ